MRIEKGVDAEILARRTTGFSGADIQSMVNVAILNAVKHSTQNKLFRQGKG